MQFEYESPKAGQKYFFRDLWVMLLDGLAHMASIPGMFLKRMADGVREWELDGNALLGVITVVATIIFTISSMIWIFSKPALVADPALLARITALEAENAQLKAKPTPVPIVAAGFVAPSPSATRGPIEIYQDLNQVVAETRVTLQELETELKEAKAKPAEAERELSEIQDEIKETQATLKEQEKELKAAQKAISAK